VLYGTRKPLNVGEHRGADHRQLVWFELNHEAASRSSQVNYFYR
jgi:hypothetical protein